MLSVRQLRYFIAAARAGSFVSGARGLNVSQPALSLQIKQLEQRLGVSLFDRVGGRSALTPAGEAFLVAAEKAVEAVREAEASVAEYRDERFAVRIGLLPTIGRAIIRDLVDRSAGAGLSIAAREGVGSQLLRDLQKGELDAAFCYDPPPGGQWNVVPLVREAPVLVCRKGLVPPDSKSVPVESLGDFPLIVGSPSNASRVMLERLAVRHGFQLNIRFTMDATSLHGEILMREDVFSFVPRGHFVTEIEAGLFQTLDIHPAPQQVLSLVIRRGISARAVDNLLALTRVTMKDALQRGLQGWLPLTD